MKAKTNAGGLHSYIGKRVTLYCCNYFYTGKLVSINKESCLLTEAGIVYDTGPHSDPKWASYQALPHNWHVMLSAVESFGIFK